ncbi:MAG: hypothetical protein GY835_22595 [bacterium]|nr:hypothetical protein [bacterium]
MAIDVEATGLEVKRGHRVFAAAITPPNGNTVVYRAPQGTTLHPENTPLLTQALASEQIDTVFHNAKFDMSMLRAAGYEINGQVWDTMILAHLMDGRDARGNLNLDAVGRKYAPQMAPKLVEEVADWFKDNKIAKADQNYEDLPKPLLRARVAGDAELTMAVFQRLFHTVAKHFPALLRQEHQLLHVVGRMEDRGIMIDVEEVTKQRERFAVIAQDMHESICELLGCKLDAFNPRAYNDMEYLFARTGVLELLPERARTPTGRYKFDDQSLRGTHHPVAHMILGYRLANKMNNTFLAQLERFHINGVLHASFNQTGTVTSRFSSSKPNLQNLPTDGPREAWGEADQAAEVEAYVGHDLTTDIKRAFKTRPGFINVHMDKAQAELAALVQYLKDPRLIESFVKRENIHTTFCQLIYGQVIPALRVRCKRLVFGTIYGAGLQRIADNLQSTLDEARRARVELQRAIPALPAWERKMETLARRQGYVTSLHGRRFYLPADELYMIPNRMCQGTVADEVKSCMVRLDDFYQRECPEAQILLQIHDDIVSEIPIDRAAEIIPQAHRIMSETVYPYDLPLPTDAKATTTCWAETKNIDPNDPSTYPKAPE